MNQTQMENPVWSCQDTFVEETPEVYFAEDFDTLFEKGENVQVKLSPIIPAKFSALIEKCGFQMKSIPPYLGNW